MTLPRQIVVAHYDESLLWLDQTAAPVIVYDKGDKAGPSSWLHLPNVGLDVHTHLHHIVTHYDDLADVTLFTQGRWDDHLPPGRHIEELFALAVDIACARIVRCKEWDESGRLKHWGKWAEWLRTGELQRAEMSLLMWFRQYLQLDLEGMGGLIYSPGSIFAVRRECIRSRPRWVYAWLREAISHHANPEEAHYMERSWLYLFWTLGKSIGSLS